MTTDIRTSEIARQTVHVLVGGLALLLRWLSWEQAALLAGVSLLFNLIVLPRLSPTLFRPEDRGRLLTSGIVLYPAAVLALVLCFRSRLDVVAVAWVILAAGDGMATLVGAHIRTAPLPWNPAKSVGGLAAFLVFGFAAAAAIAAWIHADDPFSAPASILVALSLSTLAAALVETVPIRLNDNLTVPAIAAAVFWSFTLVDEGALRASAAVVSDRWMPALGVNVTAALLGYLAKTVTVPGAVTGAVIGMLVYIGAGPAGWVLLFASFFCAAAATRAGHGRKAAAGISESRGGRRGPGNAIANTGLAACAAALSLGLPDPRLAWLAMVAGLATSASDTVASEIGKAWGRTTILLAGFRRVRPGTTGAISLEGTLAGVVSAVLLATLGAAMGLIAAGWIAAVVVAATVASIVEGLLGATFERSGVLNNDVLNFVNAALGAALAITMVGAS